MIRLGDLLPEDRLDRVELSDLPVTGVTADSRRVAPGFAFFALPGVKTDGARFAREAQSRGAVVVIAPASALSSFDGIAPVVGVADARRALALAAARLYPRQPAVIAAVTGTSGKTSVAAFTRQIWAALGHRAAAIGTTGIVAPEGETYGSLTTPDPVTLHAALDDLAGRGVTHLAMEASSHGLHQKRLDGVRLSAAAFTNLSRDHLDYHPTMEDYFEAKMRLFDLLSGSGAPAVIDVDSDYGHRAAQRAAERGLKVLGVGRAGDALRLVEARAHRRGAHLRVSCEGALYDVDLPLAGDFMASNALVAAGLCLGTGAAPADVLAALSHLTGAPGRLEWIADIDGASIFVDYAHKPDALQKVLQTLRASTAGALVVVFGCGGDRDPGKRPIMGAIAAAEADRVIVADDNPRSENPALIRAQILAAAPGAKEIGDRAQAIRAAVRGLRPGDVLVVAGKGHETGQIIGEATLPFSDREEILAAVAEMRQ